MGTQLSEDVVDTKSYKHAIHNLGVIFYQRFINIFYFFEFTFNLMPISKKQNSYLNIVHGFTRKVIKARKEYIKKYGFKMAELNEADDETYVYKKKKKTAMLDLLLSAEKEELIDDIGIQEEVDTFMFEVRRVCD